MLVYKTPRAWQEMHSCTQEKQWSLQEEGLKGYRVIALWLCRRVNETSDVHYKNNNMPSLLPHSTRMCAYREDYTEISQPLGHIRQPQGSRTKRSCTYMDSVFCSKLCPGTGTDQKLCRLLTKKCIYLISINFNLLTQCSDASACIGNQSVYCYQNILTISKYIELPFRESIF